MTLSRAVNEANLVAGNLALDFVNTSTSRHANSGTWTDYMTDAIEVLMWLRVAKAIDETRFREMTVIIANDQGKSALFLAKTLKLRQALGHIFTFFTGGSACHPQNELSVLNEVLSGARHAERLVWTDGKLSKIIDPKDRSSLDDALWPIAIGAERILTQISIDRIKRCGSSTCEWLFLDESKNSSRHWCQMDVCGNREKGRRRLKKSRAFELEHAH